MKKFDNIEDLFKENLNGFESDPGAGVWESISQNLASQGVAATTTVVAKVSLLKWVAGTIIVATGVTLGTVYLTSDSETKTDTKKSEENKTITTENKTEETNSTEEIVLHEDAVALQQNDIIVKDEKKNKTIIVSVKENPKFNMNKSSVDGWITKRNNYSTSNNNSNKENVAVITSNNTNEEQPATFEVKVADESKPIASIKRSVAGGLAPLTITFSNATEEKNYEWNVDGSIVKESSFVHVFEVAGTYKIRLTVKDAKGQTATDMVEITIGEPLSTEALPKSKVDTKGINVFSPNNDGTNDYFFFDCENIESFILQVVDQNSKVYFETNDPNFRWDGTMINGETIPDGKYFYFYTAIGKDKTKYQDFKPLEITTKR